MFNPQIRILIVDDQKSMRSLIKTHLRSMGYRGPIIEAVNGKEGFRNLREQFDSLLPVDLVISDWNMPDTPGIEFLRMVRAVPEFMNLPFLMITAEALPNQILEAAQAGVSQYILKPFTPATIKEKLIAVWNKHNQARG